MPDRQASAQGSARPRHQQTVGFFQVLLRLWSGTEQWGGADWNKRTKLINRALFVKAQRGVCVSNMDTIGRIVGKTRLTQWAEPLDRPNKKLKKGPTKNKPRDPFLLHKSTAEFKLLRPWCIH